MTFALVPFRELARPACVGIGRRPRRFRDGDREAIASTFGPLDWPGRTLDVGRVRHRVELRVGSTTHYFDHTYFEIKDVAFHPHDPVIAIATGKHAGHVYKGELWLWN